MNDAPTFKDILAYVESSEFSTPFEQNRRSQEDEDASLAMKARIDAKLDRNAGEEKVRGGVSIQENRIDAVGADALAKVPNNHAMLDDTALDFYLRHCVGKDPKAANVAIVTTSETRSILEGGNDIVKKLRRVEDRNGKGDLFSLGAIHFAGLSGAHFSHITVMKIYRPGGSGYHIFVSCSTGHPDRWDSNIATIVHGLALLYHAKKMEKGEGGRGGDSFDFTSVRYPKGRGQGKAARQMGGVNCGPVVAYNIECKSCFGAIYPQLRGIPEFRQYMLLRMVEEAKAQHGFSLVTDRRPTKKLRRMPKTKAGNSDGVIDLVDSSDE